MKTSARQSFGVLVRARLASAAIFCALVAAACGGGGGGGGGVGAVGNGVIGSPSPPTGAAANPGPSDGNASVSGSNVAPIILDAGPPGVTGIVNVPFVSVRVCAPGTSSCQTIDHVILDTGSTGLRLIASAVTNLSALQQQSDSSNNPIAECAQFVSSYSWGTVKLADVSIAGATAASLPVQIIADPDLPAAPTSCSNAGSANNTVASLGGNGLLGVGSFRQDCGAACVSRAISGTYYACPDGNGCSPTSVPLAKQVTNPVALFPSDNNGVLIQLPAIDPRGGQNVTGSLVLGIGTRNNNGLGSAQAYGVDNSGDFTTVFNGQTYPHSFIDSGSNFLFFNTTALPKCPNLGESAFYCPPMEQTLSAVNQGINGTNGTVSFTVANAHALFTGNIGATAFNNVAGSFPGDQGFDWGLPFFFGRNVFSAIEGAPTPAGPGPYVAY